MRNVLRLLLAGVVAIAGLAFLPVPGAQAAVPTGPTAVAVASNGITYVGFAAGGSLTRVDASGSIMAPIPLPRSGPVDGLAVDSSDNIWVSHGNGVSRVSPAGAELQWIPTPGVASCPAADGSADPSRYGGVAVSTNRVFVAQRCQSGVVRSFQFNGTADGTVTLPGSTGARGVAWAPAHAGQPQRLFVAAPDAGRVYVYTAPLTNGASPTFDLDVPEGGPNPSRPSGVTVDRYTQLAVTDAANDMFYIFDANNVNGTNSYSWYRTLGRPGSNAGDLSNPTALAQYPVDGPLTDRRGDYFVGDTGNQRIQRWNVYGYTYWTASTNGGTTNPTAPVNTSPPTVQGTPAVGQTLTCNEGTWSGNPTSYTYGWNRNGSYINGQDNQTYTVQSGNAGQNLSCFVRATNGAGTSDFATSANVTVSAAPAAPANTALPVISGNAEQGSSLTCSNGTWSGSPTSYSRVWLRNGNPIAGATSTSYTVTAADVGQAITCRVTATNGSGSGQATSAAVTPTGPASCTGVAETVSINNAATFTATASVTLKAVPAGGATQILISNDGGFAGATPQALTGDCTYAWTLSGTSSRDSKVVYVRFLNGSGTVVGRASDDIVLDGTAPALAKVVKKRIKKTKQYKIKVKASDRHSGLKKVRYATKRGGQGKVTNFKRKFVTKKPYQFRWVQVIDKAGNPSDWKRLR